MSDFTPQGQELEFHKDVSPEERKEILESIDQMVTENKLTPPKTAQVLESSKKGFVFPLTINILAVAAVAASLFLSNMFFQQRQENIAEETQFYLSAEGKLLEELKKESEQKLQAKDQEIGRIQNELAELDRKSAQLAATMESTILAKEETLRREMEAALEAERQRLSREGSTEEEIQARIKELENRFQAQNNQAVETFRRESEAALEAQRRELEQTIALNQSLLDQASREKQKLQSDSLEREAALTAQFQEEKAALEAQTLQARTQLESLTQVQEQQSLLQDQINGSFQSVMTRVENREFSTALGEIEELRTLITGETVQALPAFSAREGVDLFLLDTLKKDIEGKIGLAGADSGSLIAAAERLMAAESLAQLGIDAYIGGEVEAAREYFQNSLDRLPPVAEGVRTLEAMDLTARESVMNADLSRGQELLESGEWDEAALSFTSAASKGGEESSGLTQASLEGLAAAYISKIDAETAARLAAEEKYRADRASERTRFQRELEARVAELQSDKQTALEEEQDLRSRVISEAENLNETLAEKQDEIDRMREELQRTTEESRRLETYKGEVEGLTQSFETLKIRLDRLTDSGDREDAETAEALLTEFLKEEANPILPELAELLEETGMGSDKTGGTSYDAGKREALEDVLLFTRYLNNGGGSGDKETLSDIRTKTVEDDLYARAIRDIQVLADKGNTGTAQDGGLAVATRRLGSVINISGNSITIESPQGDTPQVGAAVSVLRKSRGRGEILVATGKITSVSGNRVEAELNRNLTSSQVELTDLVYIADR